MQSTCAELVSAAIKHRAKDVKSTCADSGLDKPNFSANFYCLTGQMSNIASLRNEAGKESDMTDKLILM